MTQCSAGHRGGDGGNAGLVPTDPGIDNVRSGSFHGLAEHDDFIEIAAPFHQIQHGQAVDDNEVLTDGLPHPAYHFHRQAHAVFIAAAPVVIPLIGALRQKLVKEITNSGEDEMPTAKEKMEALLAKKKGMFQRKPVDRRA